jgi:hypothetical protein
VAFLDWKRLPPRRRRDLLSLAVAPDALVTDTDRGTGYLAVRRAVDACQLRLDSWDESEDRPVGRQGAAFARLDRMYEVAMLVAAACEVASVPPPQSVDSWPEELVRLRDCRERNAREVRSLHQSPG